MDVLTACIVVCSLYLVASLVAGILPGLRVSHSVRGFVAGDGRMGAGLMYFVLGAAVFSSFAFLGAPGWAYSRGAAAFYIIAYGVVGMVPLYFLGPRARRLGREHGFVTQAEMLAWRFRHRGLGVLMAVLSVIVFVPYLTLQMKGAGMIVDIISDGRIPPWVGAGVTYLVVVIYVLASGVMGVGWTNALQGIFMMAVAWGLGLYLPYALHGGIEPMFRALADSGREAMLVAPGLNARGQPWNWWEFSSWMLVSAVGLSCWPHLFMKSFAARSDRALRLTVVLYPTFQLFLVPILLIGFAAILAFPGIEPSDRVLPTILVSGVLPPLVAGIACAAALAASMSSGDTILHAAASIAVHDGVRPMRRKPMSDQAERWLMRGVLVAIAAIAFFFAVWSTVPIVNLLAGAYGGVAQIMPLLVAALYWPRATGAGAMAGLVGGLGVTLVFLWWPELRPWPVHEGLYGLAVNGLLLWGVSLLTADDRAPVVAGSSG